MLRFSTGFVLGVLALFQFSSLPGALVLVIEGGLLLVLVVRHAHLLIPLGVLAGFTWSHAYALVAEPTFLPEDHGVIRAIVTGDVVSLPQHRQSVTRFVLDADSVEIGERRLAGAFRLRLSWHDAPAVTAGARWSLPVRLRAAHGFATPGAWDYEGWLYWQGIRYTGYVSADAEARKLIDAGCCWLARFRQHLGLAVDELDVSARARGVIKALTLGESSGLDTQLKALLRDTGTSHLMAISGLHIGLVAGLGGLLTGLVWRRLPRLCGRVPARFAGITAGLLVAGLYALMAGMGLPTQRALIMLTLLAAATLWRQEGNPLQPLAVAAFGVLAWHPPSVLSLGFWLSFVAVAAIVSVLTWYGSQSRWRQAVRIQLAVSLALWPILGAFGVTASGAAPLINLVLVPVFSVFVVPVSLLGVMALLPLPWFGSGLLQFAATAIDLMIEALAYVDGLSFAWTSNSLLNGWQLIAALLAVALLLAPPGMPLRLLALPLFATVWLPHAPVLEHGAFKLHVLDVGQGLSTVVETRNHTLIFDTGPQYPSGFNTASNVVVPFLRTIDRGHVDRLVLSHGDNDHAGGVAELVEQITVDRVLSGEPERLDVAAARCTAGEAWQWDGVRFRFLHPQAGASWEGNNASCVLKVSNRGGSVLLTGDIEKRVERQMIERLGDELRSDVVVAAHHGSRSSSTRAFVESTRPTFVVYSAGWANRYGFPADEVKARWADAGAAGVNTADQGAIRLTFGADGQVTGPAGHRTSGWRRFWHHDTGSAEPRHAVSSSD